MLFVVAVESVGQPKGLSIRIHSHHPNVEHGSLSAKQGRKQRAPRIEPFVGERRCSLCFGPRPCRGENAALRFWPALPQPYIAKPDLSPMILQRDVPFCRQRSKGMVEFSWFAVRVAKGFPTEPDIERRDQVTV